MKRVPYGEKPLFDGYVLDSGREVYANCGIIGIDAEGEISEGYDGGIDPDDKYDKKGPWTAAERAEVAKEMMKRWQKFGNL